MAAKTEGCAIRFGTDSAWGLPVDVPCAEAVPAVDDLDASIAQALASPIGLPSLDQITVPGDVVALAVDPAVPSLPAVVSSVCRWLSDKSIEVANLRIVLASSSEALQNEVQQAIKQLGMDVQVQTHDPDASESMAYVAANENSDPIYINRTLVDSDVVLPIVCARDHRSIDYLGGCSIFPMLSNRETRGKFFSLPRLDNAKRHAKLTAWSDEAARWLGIIAGIQILPASDGFVAAAFCGLLDAMDHPVQRRLQELWSTEASSSDLVVAILDGSPAQHTWYQVALGLRAATQFVTPGGSIALCTQLSEAVGKGLNLLCESHHDRDEIASQLASDANDNSLPAAVILQTTADYHVYLASKLRKPAVESLGLAVLESESQLINLIQQHSSTLILSSAQHRYPAEPTSDS